MCNCNAINIRNEVRNVVWKITIAIRGIRIETITKILGYLDLYIYFQCKLSKLVLIKVKNN